MDHKWFKGYKDKAKRTQEVMSYSTAFKELGTLLAPKKPTAADYESPSWAYKQAHSNGYNQAIEEVLKLINITKDT